LATGTAWGEWGADEIKDVMTGGNALGFIPKGMSEGFHFSSVMPDYAVSGLPEIAGYILSAIAGVAILIILFRVISSFKKDKVGSLNG
jgi:cobalt/nickel transport system permease protein